MFLFPEHFDRYMHILRVCMRLRSILGYFIRRDFGEGREQKLHVMISAEVIDNLESKAVTLDDLLQRFNIQDSNEVSTLIIPGSSLMASTSPPDATDSERLNTIPYQNAVGSLLYLYVYQATWPDFVFAVSTVSRFNNNFNESHWIAVKRTIKYLKSTRNLKLTYSISAEQYLVGH